MQNIHEHFMKEALKEAIKAFDKGEVPIGAVIVLGQKIIARAHNQTEMLKDPTAHAEMIAITQAASVMEHARLEKAVIYVTMEPCAMCAGALVQARVKELYYGAADPKAGACGTLFNIVGDDRLNHRIPTMGGLMECDSRSLLQEFFRNLRKEKR
ncbi:MAG: nucleoside deaminase [Candidatus Omnitrophica bacterium]|nr:nucleoside deaminase [Candidatus Omnitrophota bacterium]